jgi:hypothetical protein
MFAHLATLLVLAADGPSAGNDTALKYFGWYGSGWLDAETGPHANFYQARSAEDAVLAKASGQNSLLIVESLFPGLFTASPDFTTKWLPALPELKALLANGTIFGFALGDELVWGGVRPANLVKYANTVRDAFPRGQAIIWSNEAAFFSGSRVNWHNAKKEDVSDYQIPSALDWFSVDLYHMDGPVPEWPQDHVKVWYETNIYPNLTHAQQVMLVPGAFGSHVNHYPNGTYVCDNACYDRMCALDAAGFFGWAKTDPRVVAISPWYWGGCPSCNGSRWTPPHTCCMDEIGAKDQPLTKAAWFKIADEIIASS